MHQSVLDFAKEALTLHEVAGRFVLEVGSLNVNGSVRPIVEALAPAGYLGVDVVQGPGVDRVLDASILPRVLGRGNYGVVICTEMLEHAFDWREVVSALKAVLAPLGTLLLTTRSQGFARHHPPDYWRFGLTDMEAIFGDLRIIELRKDPGGSGGGPGVFLKAIKPGAFHERNLDGYSVYSMEAEA